MPDLALELDTWMRAQPRWVSRREIEERFGVDQRRLRFDQGEPGLLTLNCISSSVPGFSGYKHVVQATDAEFEEADRKDRKAVWSRYRALRERRRRRRAARTNQPVPVEIHTGQFLMFE